MFSVRTTCPYKQYFSMSASKNIHTHKYASHVHKHTNCDSGFYQPTLVFSDNDKNPDLIHFTQYLSVFALVIFQNIERLIKNKNSLPTLNK